MHFGVMMFVTDYSMSAPDLAIAAEERGFESMWIPENLDSQAGCYKPFRIANQHGFLMFFSRRLPRANRNQETFFLYG